MESATLEPVAGRPVLRSSQEAKAALLTALLHQCAGVDLQDLIVAPTKEYSRGIAAAARIERVVALRVDLRVR